MSKVQELLESHPHWPAVKAIYHKLDSHGYKAFLAGGCVRDALLSIPANDLDVATDATPDQIEALFDKTVNVGKVFGVMRVLQDGADIEVATFRTDGTYADGRRPDEVHFSSPEEDAKRRDFTVNALFYDLAQNKVLDFVQGQEDLKAHTLRTVGIAEQRFKEDHLRLLRAARFVAQLDFTLENKTYLALQTMAAEVKTVSGERLRDEMIKLLKSKAVAKGLKIMSDSGLLRHLFPFRERDNSWQGTFGGTEDWQLLSLFFRKAEIQEVQSSLQMLRLSTKDLRAILRAWTTFQRPEEFLHLRLGLQLQAMQDPGIAFVFEVLIQEQHAKAAEMKNLLQAYKTLGTLPAPLLTGEDVKGHLQGKSIGICLTEAYCLQLESKITTRDSALNWLQDYLKKESNG
ncbi:CCA tRNA nucleotidyltransferase [Bdellovibrio reynosensis]|uniref:CCA tRNA nucleotidyltransferase n=1 Tax=Bdellovibrio reynosensis TaxID=2835041 RepID=A0ABY4CBJ0_9BACT|nr:CCA tRNA nucleotidyltransferase [Bdellovibrio reynosensis]UOF02149.1 CCA tRNA nucleotidyltransferase [Bdellovibrio reynosensis]